MPPYLIGLDATAIGSGHGIRGIGRFVESLVSALVGEQPAWAARHLGLLVNDPRAVPPGIARSWRTVRAAIRPQDTGWVVAAAADRLATRSSAPDLWHETDPSLPLGPGPANRSLVTAYDLIPLTEPEIMRRMRPHRRLLYRRYLARLREARGLLAISEHTAHDLVARLGVSARRIHVVYPSVVGLAAAAATPAAVPDRQERDRLLFVGIPDPHKRPDLAIRVLVEARRWRPELGLDFVGYHPPAARARLAELGRALGVADAIRFLGRVDDGQLASLYRSGVLLALSRLEGFGLPPVEALLSGGRAVAVPVDIYREVLGTAARFAESDAPQAIAAAVRDAVEGAPDPSAVAALRARYSPAAVAACAVEAYERTLR